MTCVRERGRVEAPAPMTAPRFLRPAGEGLLTAGIDGSMVPEVDAGRVAGGEPGGTPPAKTDPESVYGGVGSAQKCGPPLASLAGHTPPVSALQTWP